MRGRLDPNDREFLERLHRLGAATIPGMCDALGVTATAVRQRLTRLQAQGLVDRETVRAGRGRPHHTYRVTDDGQRELGDNYADLAMILWDQLRTIEEPALRSRVLEGVQQALVSRFGKVVRGESLDERLRELGQALADRGYNVEVDSSSGLPILRENSCPYHELASSDPSICELEQAVFRKVLNADVRLAQCCLEGHSCCEFHATATVAPPAVTDTVTG